ncbi:class I SAM-dependent methyltransferase [Halomarina halobia]|uniref:Class I SAM-dependent methyltransferase n=1 Tax=Halomarina halobia TaxID=3033386 RepID=A0ABD6A818_9EURY|nr:class I SAM-dependent methyltransferase [Halomarina sp. PSR21]
MDYNSKREKYWDRSAETNSRYSASGIRAYPEPINRYRKEALFSTINTVLKAQSIELPDLRILDAGCGTGAYAEFYANAGVDLHGVDISSKSLTAIRAARIPGTYTQARLDNLPYSDETFDLVHCFSVLYHILDDNEWINSLAELQRVTRPGGWLLLRIEWVDKSRRPASHVKHRPRNKYLNQLVEEGPFSLEHVEHFADVPMFEQLTAKLPGLDITGARLFILFSLLAINLDLFHENPDQRILLLRKHP